MIGARQKLGTILEIKCFKNKDNNKVSQIKILPLSGSLEPTSGCLDYSIEFIFLSECWYYKLFPAHRLFQMSYFCENLNGLLSIYYFVYFQNLIGNWTQIWLEKNKQKTSKSIGEKLKTKNLMFHLFHVIGKISNFDMWTAKR